MLADLFDDEPETITLREYQERGIDGIFKCLEENQSTLLVMATGTGKTTVFGEFIRRFGKRTVVLAHREELIFQASDRLSSMGMDTDIEMGDIYCREYAKPQVVVSTIQTHKSKGRMGKFNPMEFGLVVVDEGHHSTSPSYRRVLDYYRQNPEIKILAVTATPDRADEEALGQVFETVAFEYDILDAIKDGYLVPIEQQMVSIEDLDFSGIKTTCGDLNSAELASVMEAESNLHGVASATLSIAGDKKTLVFTASVKQAENLAEIFNRHRAGMAAWICGDTPKDQRRKILRQFSAGSFQIMVNCGVLLEGYDEPTIECVVQARPTKSRSLYAQIIGRGTRPLAGVTDLPCGPDGRRSAIANSEKPALLVIDFVGNCGRHKLISTADVLGGKCSDDAVELAAEIMRKSDKPMRTEEAIEKALKELEERRLKEAARRAGVKGIASFKAASVDPFDVFNIRPEVARGWDRVKTVSDKMKALLEKNGIKTDDLSFTKARQLVGEIFNRREKGLCTFKQAKILNKNGYDGTNATFAEASELITKIFGGK